jgi:hypothetical protein
MIDKNELHESIERFLDYFDKQLSIVKEVDFKEEVSDCLFKKILYVGFIDALSKTVASPKKGNRERIVSFILNFTDWNNAEKISLPHLVRYLEKVPDPEFSDLREYVYSLIDDL